ncbi:MAG: shikimate dehydrogenase [Abitibacteriaceae bacterium]|nr:shikimate dehydrogenase [Abditibacteriaceae bacterium]MBV9864966.1 shikimate dehydrogenase [Abditibacteriaceae bacterium]
MSELLRPDVVAPRPITATTRTIAIIGDPIEHSLTPRIQNLALQEIGANVVNVAFHVTPAHLEQAVRGARALGLLGLMVTIPHKEAVLSLCDELDDSAQAMGAANLLHFHPDGRIVGYSTDGWAALKSLAEEGARVRDARIAILGGGGAARSLAITFAHAGAASIVVLNRTVERAAQIADEISFMGQQARALPLDENTLREVLPQTDLLVNATSVGMHPHDDATPIPTSYLHAGLMVYDIVYNPLETRLLRDAKAAGARIVDGLGMLIYTNVRAVQICANLEISAATMRREALNALAKP